MSEVVGSAAYIAWIQAAATTTLQADYRSFNWSPTMDFVDASAGSDTYEVLLPSIGRGNEFSVVAVYQTGTAGTAQVAPFDRGNLGTVKWGPDGSAAGKLSYSIPAYAMGVQWNMAYADVTEITINFRQSAAETRGTF